MNKNQHSSLAWLYEQDERQDESFHLLAEIVADSIEKTQQGFDETNGQLLQFYKNERNWYDELLLLIEKKQQLRAFVQMMQQLRGID
jgi:hypothetical protein